jgi:H+/Cl- antiporter ClcA
MMRVIKVIGIVAGIGLALLCVVMALAYFFSWWADIAAEIRENYSNAWGLAFLISPSAFVALIAFLPFAIDVTKPKGPKLP